MNEQLFARCSYQTRLCFHIFSYALLYSCWEETEDSYCEPDGAYAGIITRNRDPLPEEQLTELKGLVAGACINPDALKKVRHEGYCKKEHTLVSDSEAKIDQGILEVVYTKEFGKDIHFVCVL